MADHDTLIRIDENVKFIKQQLEDGAKVMASHEKRITQLEKRWVWMTGIAVGISFLIAQAKNIIHFIGGGK